MSQNFPSGSGDRRQMGAGLRCGPRQGRHPDSLMGGVPAMESGNTGRVGAWQVDSEGWVELSTGCTGVGLSVGRAGGTIRQTAGVLRGDRPGGIRTAVTAGDIGEKLRLEDRQNQGPGKGVRVCKRKDC